MVTLDFEVILVIPGFIIHDKFLRSRCFLRRRLRDRVHIQIFDKREQFLTDLIETASVDQPFIIIIDDLDFDLDFLIFCLFYGFDDFFVRAVATNFFPHILSIEIGENQNSLTLAFVFIGDDIFDRIIDTFSCGFKDTFYFGLRIIL